jgi:hypothetical protein
MVGWLVRHAVHLVFNLKVNWLRKEMGNMASHDRVQLLAPRVNSNLVVISLLGAVLVLVGLFSPASGGYYEETYTEPWSGCYSNHGGAQPFPPDPNNSDAACNEDYGTMSVLSQLRAYAGKPWAEAEVWLDFTYAHRHPYLNKFEFEFDIAGEMDTASTQGTAHNAFYLTAELWWGTTCLRADTIYNIVDADSIIPFHTETYDDFYYCLHPWRSYQVKLRAWAECEYGSLGDTASVDFWYAASNGIELDSLTISHVHGGTFDSSNVNSDLKKVSEEYQIAQKEYGDPGPDSLTFSSVNTENDIGGYYIEITDFYRSTSEYNGDRKIDVTAGGWSICKNCTVTVYVRHYLDEEGCPNEMSMRDPTWVKSDGESQILQAGETKIMPDWDWDLSPPVEMDAHPDSFSHTFTMTNADDVDTLKISALQFLPTDILYDPLSTVPFPGWPTFSFSLPPGDSWEYDIHTFGNFADNHIYFNYGINGVSDSTSSSVVCNAWGHHTVYYDDALAGVPHEERPDKPVLPEGFKLHQNVPNPFGMATEIRYDLPARCEVSLAIYDVMGRKIRVLADAVQPPGYKTALWDGRNDDGEEVPGGIYFYRLAAGDYVGTKKLALLK